MGICKFLYINYRSGFGNVIGRCMISDSDIDFGASFVMKQMMLIPVQSHAD